MTAPHRPGNAGIRNVLSLAAAAALLLLAGILFLAFVRSSFPALAAERARKAAMSPLLREAARLGVTYESALSSPAASLGKPAVWCLRRVSGTQALYEGAEGKPVYFADPPGLPASGTYRRTCDRTLIKVKDVTAYDFSGGVGAVRLTAEFVGYP